MTSKYFFNFRTFEDLQIGDVFRFDADSPFFTVLRKTDNRTVIQRTYGKILGTDCYIDNEVKFKEVLIYPDRKRKIITK